MHNGQPLKLPEYNIHLRPSSHASSLTTYNSSEPKDVLSPSSEKDTRSSNTSACSCYVPSTANQHFRILVTNKSDTDACISVFVDGEWVYTGLSYPPLHKAIYFSGRLIDQNTVQEMRFTELDTTCRPLALNLWEILNGVLKVDDANDGEYARPEIGTIVVKIYRVKVTGPWDGKWEAAKHTATNTKPVLVSEKSSKEPAADTRVGSVSIPQLQT